MPKLQWIKCFWNKQKSKSNTPNLMDSNTRFYKLPKEKVFKNVIQAMEKWPNSHIAKINREDGEIFLEMKTSLGMNDIVISVYRIRPYYTGIDIICSNQRRGGEYTENSNKIREILEAIHFEMRNL